MMEMTKDEMVHMRLRPELKKKLEIILKIAEHNHIEFSDEFSSFNLDFNYIICNGVNLNNKSLMGSSFIGAKLNQSVFSNCDLRGVDFCDAKLVKANFHNADLSDSNMNGADLRGADLSRSDLRGVSFEGAKVHGANFHNALGVNLEGALLDEDEM